MEKFKQWQSYLLIVLCILLNLAGRKFAATLQLPFWLDTIGTIVTAIELGPLGGAITGALSNLVISMNDIGNIAYIAVSVAIGVNVGVFYPKGRKADPFLVVATAVLTGIISVIISSPLNMFLLDGQTGNVWGDNLILMLSQSVNVPWLCSILGQAFVEIPDKTVAVFVAVILVMIIRRIKQIFSDKKSGTAALLIVLVLSQAMLAGSVSTVARAAEDSGDAVLEAEDTSGQVEAESANAAGSEDPETTTTTEPEDIITGTNFASEYAAVGYDTDDGLESAEINTLAQTPDGFVWAGTYSGLYRYDGYRFEKSDIDERISNVMQLFVDSKGNLWIGTNDSGIGCFSPETEEIVFYTTEDGLSSNAIRAICEDSEGNIYVGTVNELNVIKKDGSVTKFTENRLHGALVLQYSDGIMSGVTSYGQMFFIKNGTLLSSYAMETDNNINYYTMAAGKPGEYLVGTSANFALKIRLLEDGTIKTEKQIRTDSAYTFNKIIYSAENDGFFYCCENGLGFIDSNDKVTDMTVDDFNNAVADVIIDYQNNIWFASNKQGIERFSWNPFEDVFERAGISEDVVNSLLIKDGILYIGMGNGLEVVDIATLKKRNFAKKDFFNGVRVRNLMSDSKGNIWVSTYGQDGLIELTEDGDLLTFNEATADTVGSRFRLTQELSDGTILAVSSSGLNFIKDGKVESTISSEDGLGSMVLSVVEREDGTLLAGTDGNGVYIIKDRKVVDNINNDDGLGSPVIMKIVPCARGYIFVTSNALYQYYENRIRKLNAFPYSNNYDVYITDSGEAWVSSSAGIYIVNETDLLENREYSYTLLNRTRGLYTSLTSNASNAVCGDDLYLCCTDGVRKISLSGYNSFDNNYNIKISRLTAADKLVKETDGVYRIPAIQGRIQFEVAVLNYTLSNPLIRIFLEGSGDKGITCFQNDMEHLVYTNLPYGNYKLHVQVLDPVDDSVIREEIFDVEKESLLYERLYFKLYLMSVCMLFVFFIGWLIGKIRKGFLSAKTWQKEATTDPMTGLLNKAASKRELTELCKNKKGILMMIDLDSFKLVNDLYGHDMGDRILIRFADIIRSCIRENDLAGRMGGDEFIAFIQGTSEESAVAEKAEIINAEIIKSAKEFMGEDMNIPLGASIGAVIAPDEGTDYEKLFSLADKALYNVKQNGKHGYAMYRKSNPKLTENAESKIMGIDGIRKILGERNEGKGAYRVDFNKLQAIYRTFVRLSKRVDARVWIVQFVVNPPEGAELSEEVIEEFYEVLAGTLRANDVVAPNGKNQVLAILTDIDPENGTAPIERIMKKWEDAPGHEGYTVEYETEAL